ncbi:type IV secretory system conjugative DNA transfer family protein [Streptomyces sp. NPDC014894]|uniref:type IV secretory system conjugative DNA transfer family protein n=1 Tax=Streptomyces sp. NPDC014894 TaxID=3364931 RepID=UPI0036FCB172
MRRSEPLRHDRERAGGVPDGLLLGLLGLGVSSLVLAWTATGLSGLFAHGSWPAHVTFKNAPQAVRSLVTAPQDLPAAWPGTPAAELSGYGLFWGIAIGELMVLLVLTVFALGTLARWKTLRAARRAERLHQDAVRREQDRQNAEAVRDRGYERAPAAAPVPAPPPVAMTKEATPREAAPHAAPADPAPTATAADPVPVVAAAAATPAPTAAAAEPPAAVPAPRAPRLVYGDPATRRPAALQAVLDAEGPAVVVTSDPLVWSETKDARAKLGPVLVYDPGHLCDTPARLHWSPTSRCEDADTAAARATALLAPVRPRALIDAAMADTAETLLRCWLHAAAVDGRPVKQVHRWAQGGGAQEAVRILRTHPKAAGGLAGLLESALIAHPERREVAQELVARALSGLSSIHIREACTPNRTDSLTLESFADEGGTLYLVGEPIEDPRSRPGAMPLLTALAADVVEHGRRMAARSSAGRLDPPMALVLDDIAAVAPLPRLPELLATGQDQGLPTLVLLRSAEQARARWPEPLSH